eukprot:83245-Karenia_brevis.AAC.1
MTSRCKALVTALRPMCCIVTGAKQFERPLISAQPMRLGFAHATITVDFCFASKSAGTAVFM